MHLLVDENHIPLLTIGPGGRSGGAKTHAANAVPALPVNVNASTASQTFPEAMQTQSSHLFPGKQLLAAQYASCLPRQVAGVLVGTTGHNGGGTGVGVGVGIGVGARMWITARRFCIRSVVENSVDSP